MPLLCNICDANVTAVRAPGLQCGGSCKKYFHTKCVNLSKDRFDLIAKGSVLWACSSCKKPLRKSLIIPLVDNSQIANPPLSNPVAVPSKSSKITKDASSSNQLDFIKTTLKKLEEARQLDLLTIEELTLKVNQLENKLSILDEIVFENQNLRKQIINLESNQIDNDQQLRQNNVEIVGVPESSSENLCDIIQSISSAISYPINTNQLESYHRVQVFQNRSVNSEPKPRNIVLKFHDKCMRNNFIKSYKKSKPLSLNNLNINFSSTNTNLNKKIFINEHLNPKTKATLLLVKKFVK